MLYKRVMYNFIQDIKVKDIIYYILSQLGYIAFRDTCTIYSTIFNVPYGGLIIGYYNITLNITN